METIQITLVTNRIWLTPLNEAGHAFYGNVEILGVFFRVLAIQVGADGQPPENCDPAARRWWEDTRAGYRDKHIQTVRLPGRLGNYILTITPFGD